MSVYSVEPRTRKLVSEATAALVKDDLGANVLQGEIEETSLLANTKLSQSVEGFDVRGDHLLECWCLERLVGGVLEDPLALQSVELCNWWSHYEGYMW